MCNATETAIRSIIVFPADDCEDQPGIAYGDVEYRGRRYGLQYSRPRHPTTIGRLLDQGVDVHTDEGHDDNADFRLAIGVDVDFRAVIAHIASASRAKAAIKRSER